jgi:predicted glycogen debranching enzyme
MPLFDETVCQTPDQSIHREWLETNGIGGYSSSSVLGCHSRKYHGLFVPSLPELHNKFVLLSKMETSLVIDGQEIELSTNHYPGALHPQGYQKLKSFDAAPCPTWIYEVQGVTLKVSLMLIQGQDQLMLSYECLDAPSSNITLRSKPFLAYRVNHELTQKNEFISGQVTPEKKGFSLSPYEGMPSLFFNSADELKTESYDAWFLNLEFYRERERGFDHHEDLYCPCTIEVTLGKGESHVLSVSLEEQKGDLKKVWNGELKRRAGRAKLAEKCPTPEWKTLHEQGEQFLTRNARGELSITAGFPWFVEWGRDTMIALPGLTIYRDQPELGYQVLLSYAKHEKNGLIPNYLAIGDGEHSYNSIDASLWFFWAIGELMKVKGYKAKITEHILPTMENIIRAYMKDQVPQAKLREDGLIYAGNPGTQLTWMDANAYGRPATSRHGCPVEINALFIHAIYLYKQCFPNTTTLQGINELESKMRASFVKEFWIEEHGYLADVVRNEKDASIRPNQIFAVSLDSCPLSKEQKRRVVEIVRRDLFTPYGLRTLSADHPQFRARYEGNGDERDSGYHQGTVWPWLLGHFIEASLITADDPRYEAQRLKDDLSPLCQGHLWEYGLGSIAEVYDATAPHRPAGCIGQAWSVAEMLRGLTLMQRHLA